jgi:hypothetical protein
VDCDEQDVPAQSFVVRVWAEPAEDDGPVLRGHITHVGGGEDRYFRALDAIPDFIQPFLASLGIGRGSSSFLQRWWRFVSGARR